MGEVLSTFRSSLLSLWPVRYLGLGWRSDHDKAVARQARQKILSFLSLFTASTPNMAVPDSVASLVPVAGGTGGLLGSVICKRCNEEQVTHAIRSERVCRYVSRLVFFLRLTLTAVAHASPSTSQRRL
jgi:hypothetical protein